VNIPCLLLFTCLLFLAAGSVIMGMERGHESNPHSGSPDGEIDPQDMRNMGGLHKRMPFTFWVYLAGALALAGIAPLAGFFSKDEILTSLLAYSPFLFGILLLTTFLTAFYMGRQILMVFTGKARSKAAEHASESSAIFIIPLVILAALSILGGVINLPGVSILEKWIDHTLELEKAAQFSWIVALASLLLSFLGLGLAWSVYGYRSLAGLQKTDPLENRLGGFFQVIQNKFWVDEFYQWLIIRPYRYFSDEILTRWFDQETIDSAVNDLGRLNVLMAGFVSKIQNGFVRTYALIVLLGVVAMLAFLLTR
jgi:NADH-quinone oxidoreductase subunit L